jgi:hypothetical protein
MAHRTFVRHCPWHLLHGIRPISRSSSTFHLSVSRVTVLVLCIVHTSHSARPAPISWSLIPTHRNLAISVRQKFLLPSSPSPTQLTVLYTSMYPPVQHRTLPHYTVRRVHIGTPASPVTPQMSLRKRPHRVGQAKQPSRTGPSQPSTH